MHHLRSPPYTQEPTPYRIANASKLHITWTPPSKEHNVRSRMGPKCTSKTFRMVRLVDEMIWPSVRPGDGDSTRCPFILSSLFVAGSLSILTRRMISSVRSTTLVRFAGALSNIVNEGCKRSVFASYLWSAHSMLSPTKAAYVAGKGRS
jgi:hypothetical protein